MKIVFPLFVLSVLLLSSCGQKKSGKLADGVVVYDTIPVTNIQIAPEYYFAGFFTYMADAAVLREAATGQDIPIAMVEKYPEAEKRYTEQGVEVGKPVYAELRGFLQTKKEGEEGADKQLVISQVLKMDKSGKASLSGLTGTYITSDLLLKVNPNHTYSLSSSAGETESGKWYLYDNDIAVFNAGSRHTIMDIRKSGRELVTREDVPATFAKK